ncbi:MAG TPA: radical SAM protein [Bdellovibrionota bacterium]|nr:radical SAM protein [Bdellovibrionota bacterium]
MKARFPHFHLIEHAEEYLLYHREASSLIRLSKDFGEIAKQLQTGKETVEIAAELGGSEESVSEAISVMERTQSRLDQIKLKTMTREKPISLYLNVSNACNLGCGYCFANGGTYNSPPGMMGPDLAFQAVDRFYEAFGHIGTITFFGGEPMLQAPLIPKVCEYALEQSKRRGASEPAFSLVTNGTLLTPQNVEMLAKYRFGVTVSIDGPEPINDLLRPTLSGKGSYSKIASGLRLLKEMGISPNIESTYTTKHREMGITPKTLLEFFRDEFGSRSITIGPAAGEVEDSSATREFYDFLIPAFREAARFSLETLGSDRPIVLYQVSHVLGLFFVKEKRPSNQFCYANLGKDLFSVSSTGKVFPCQMMNDRAEFDMGHISNADFSHAPKFQQVQSKFEGMNKEEMQCHSCWAQDLCFICVAGVEIETKRLKPIPKHRCDLIRGVIEEILIHLSRLQGDSQRLDKVLDNCFNRADEPGSDNKSR